MRKRWKAGKKVIWRQAFDNIKQRCENPKFRKYEYYGGRGIQCHVTTRDLKYTFYRDKAYLMKNPSIDRKDTDGNYDKSNIHWIEFSENRKKRWKMKKKG